MDQQLCSQERKCCVDQEELEPLQIKDKPEPAQYKKVPDDLEHQWIKAEQEEPEPPQIKKVTDAVEPSQIKVKREELRISQDLDRMVVEQETDTIRVLQYWSQFDGGPRGSENSKVECKEVIHGQPRQLGGACKPVLKLHRMGK